MHSPEHSTSLAAHVAVHAPLLHSIPPGHTVPHAPQFCVSLTMSVQVEPHSPNGAGQLDASGGANPLSPHAHSPTTHATTTKILVIVDHVIKAPLARKAQAAQA